VQLQSNRRFGLDPLSDGEMHLIKGTYGNISNALYAKKPSFELSIRSIGTNRPHVIRPVVEWRNASHYRDLKYVQQAVW